MSHVINTYTRSLPRSLANFDRVFEEITGMAKETFKNSGFPFHDIVKVGENSIKFVFALAGYTKDEVEIEQQGDKLTVSASKVAEDDENESYIYRGIAKSSFTRTFGLPQYAVIKGAEMKDGLLTINVDIEIPEERKPRKIKIVDASAENTPVNDVENDVEEAKE